MTLEERLDAYLLSLHSSSWSRSFEIAHPKGRAQTVEWAALQIRRIFPEVSFDGDEIVGPDGVTAAAGPTGRETILTERVSDLERFRDDLLASFRAIGFECRNYSSGPGSCAQDWSGRTRDGTDQVSSWCEGCIAWDALGRPEAGGAE